MHGHVSCDYLMEMGVSIFNKNVSVVDEGPPRFTHYTYDGYAKDGANAEDSIQKYYYCISLLR